MVPAVVGADCIVTVLYSYPLPQVFDAVNTTESTPGARPVSTPDEEITAFGFVTPQAPLMALVSVMVAPVHTEAAPAIAGGSGKDSIVTTCAAEALHGPRVTVYKMVSMPGKCVVTAPPETLALPFVADHVPPVMLADSVVDEPLQTTLVPLMMPGNGVGLMVTIFVAVAVPQKLV